jgi:hypothetical protein
MSGPVKSVKKVVKNVGEAVSKPVKQAVAPEPKVVYQDRVVEKEVERPPEPKKAVSTVGSGQKANMGQTGTAGRVTAARGARYRPVLTGPGGVTDPASVRKKKLLGA